MHYTNTTCFVFMYLKSHMPTTVLLHSITQTGTGAQEINNFSEFILYDFQNKDSFHE